MIGTHNIIENDTLGIAPRLRQIDETYFLAFNYKAGRFEVHSNEQRGSTLCVALPYSSLDERAIRYVSISRRENRKQFLADMERENERLERERIARVARKAEKETERAFRGGLSQ